MDMADNSYSGSPSFFQLPYTCPGNWKQTGNGVTRAYPPVG